MEDILASIFEIIFEFIFEFAKSDKLPPFLKFLVYLSIATFYGVVFVFISYLILKLDHVVAQLFLILVDGFLLFGLIKLFKMYMTTKEEGGL